MPIILDISVSYTKYYVQINNILNNLLMLWHRENTMTQSVVCILTWQNNIY